MLVPICLLAVGAVFAGFAFHEPFIEGEAFWNGSVWFNEALIHSMHEVPLWVKLAATVAMLLGFVFAFWAYIKDTSIPAKAAEQLGPIYSFLFNKWYFDEIYDALIIKPAFRIGRFFWKRGDEKTINRFGPDGVAWVVAKGSLAAKRSQTGYVYSYALVMLLGLVAAVSWVLV